MNMGNKTILAQCTGWTIIIRIVHIEMRYVQVLYSNRPCIYVVSK